MNRWVVFVCAILLYSVSVFGNFVQDDNVVIVGDPGMGKLESLMAVWTRPYYYMQANEFSVYRPLTSFSFYVNSLMTGVHPWGFRSGNVILYGICCVLVFELMRKISRNETATLPGGVRSFDFAQDDENDNDKCVLMDCRGLGTKLAMMTNELAFWGAMLFAVLPIHAEVVNNIVGRAEILSLIFVILAMLANFRNKWDLSAVFLFLGLMSKETAIVGVPILIYLTIQRGTFCNVPGWIPGQVGNDKNKNKDRKNMREEKVAAMVFVMMALVGFVAIRSVVLGGVGTENKATMVENPLKFVSNSQRIMNGISLIPFGVEKVILPINLSYDYSFNQLKLVDSWVDWRVVLGMLMIVGSGILLIMKMRSPKKNTHGIGVEGDLSTLLEMTGLLGVMFFWVPILLTGNILFPIGTIFAERLWFVPSLGVVMLLLGGTNQLRVRNEFGKVAKVFRVVVIGLVFLYAGRTVIRNFDWLSQKRLFLHDVKYASGSVMAQNNAAAMYFLENDLEAGRRHLEIGESIYPKYPELLNNRGVYFLRVGQPDKAVLKWEECLEERSGYELCEANLNDLKKRGNE